MKKRIVIIMLILAIIVGLVILFMIGKDVYEKYRIKHAKIEVVTIDDMTARFDEKKYISEYISSINGRIVKDKKIDTTKLGSQKISFEFINDENIKVPYAIDIEVIDDEAPLVWLGSSYSITTSFEGTLEDKIMCADYYDDEPDCKVVGEYDTKQVGNYPLHFIAKDKSGNTTDIPFTLKVSAPKNGGSNYVPEKFLFEDAKAHFGLDKIKYGIDVSSWQGDIDFAKLKAANVDFAFVRVGSTWGKDGEYFLDSKFERNMKGFNEVGIPVGAYFYSYATNEEEAREEAEWIIEHLKNYKVDLPIAFDFEDWGRYNHYKMSLYRLNRNAEVFMETLSKAGYEGMLYGSASYLNKVWNTDDKTIWGAHYTKSADYRGKYKYWQFSASGKVDGINGDVDLDLMYE